MAIDDVRTFRTEYTISLWSSEPRRVVEEASAVELRTIKVSKLGLVVLVKFACIGGDGLDGAIPSLSTKMTAMFEAQRSTSPDC